MEKWTSFGLAFANFSPSLASAWAQTLANDACDGCAAGGQGATVNASKWRNRSRTSTRSPSFAESLRSKTSPSLSDRLGGFASFPGRLAGGGYGERAGSVGLHGLHGLAVYGRYSLCLSMKMLICWSNCTVM